MLDALSFEKFLAAAWVLQCRRDQQLTSLQPSLGETIGLPAGSQTELAPGWRSEAKTTVSPGLTATENVGPIPVEPQNAELGPKEHSEGMSLLIPVEEKSAVEEKLAANIEARQPKLSFDLRTTFSNLYRTFNNYQNTFRISFPRYAIRKIAFTTPILVLAVLSAGLLLEMRHHESAQSAQGISQSSTVSSDTTTPGGSTTLAGTTQSASPQLGVTATSASLLVPSIPALQSSHLQITDAPAASVVRELSRYEIRGLRRRARYGDPTAAFELGMAYETGRHLRQSCREAAHWVAKAAAAGNSAAEYNLGLRYRTGDGVRPNSTQSQRWLRRAARRNPKAKLALKLLASR
jgi:Sel1 repeat